MVDAYASLSKGLRSGVHHQPQVQSFQMWQYVTSRAAMKLHGSGLYVYVRAVGAPINCKVLTRKFSRSYHKMIIGEYSI